MYTRRMTKAETEGEYEKETGRVIVESFDRLKPNYTPAGLVNNHGPFTWGKMRTKPYTMPSFWSKLPK